MYVPYRGAEIIVVAKRKHLLRPGFFWSSLKIHGGSSDYYVAEVTIDGKVHTSHPCRTASLALQAGKDFVDNGRW